MTINRIIFWQPFASPHQEAFLEAVAGQFQGEVILAVESEMPAERVAQGWRKPEHKLVHVQNVSGPAIHAALTQHVGPDSLHVFTGFFSHPLVWKAFRTLAPSQARLAIYSEAPEQPPPTGWLKRLRGRWLAARYAKRFAFVLAIGGIGCEFFETIGFPRDKIVPFGYYFHGPAVPSIVVRPTPDPVVRFISAGQLIQRKGIDLLIKACALLPPGGWQLDIYGDGPERDRLQQRVARLGLQARVAFHGTVQSATLAGAIAAADCAILPSRFDGWGALVTEALAVGTPAICTNRCGAAAAISSQSMRSAVVRTSAEAITEKLAEAVAAGPVPLEQRGRIAGEFASWGAPRLAAGRFLKAVEHVLS